MRASMLSPNPVAATPPSYTDLCPRAGLKVKALSSSWACRLAMSFPKKPLRLFAPEHPGLGSTSGSRPVAASHDGWVGLDPVVRLVERFAAASFRGDSSPPPWPSRHGGRRRAPGAPTAASGRPRGAVSPRRRSPRRTICHRRGHRSRLEHAEPGLRWPRGSLVPPSTRRRSPLRPPRRGRWSLRPARALAVRTKGLRTASAGSSSRYPLSVAITRSRVGASSFAEPVPQAPDPQPPPALTSCHSYHVFAVRIEPKRRRTSSPSRTRPRTRSTRATSRATPSPVGVETRRGSSHRSAARARARLCLRRAAPASRRSVTRSTGAKVLPEGPS